MNRAFHDKKDTSAFSYTFRSQAPQQEEKEPDLGVSKIEIADSRRAVMSRLSGIYDGHFNLKTEGPEPLKIIENGLKFRLQDQRYNIEGSANTSMPKEGSSQCTWCSSGKRENLNDPSYHENANCITCITHLYHTKIARAPTLKCTFDYYETLNSRFALEHRYH